MHFIVFSLGLPSELRTSLELSNVQGIFQAGVCAPCN